MLNFLFPPPPSLFINAISVLSLTSLAYSGISEILGRHLQYSKFWNANHPLSSPNRKKIKISSRIGMLLLYSPALAAALASFAVPGLVSSARSRLLSAALTIHFFKRDFEVLFIHRYSGHMILDSVIVIAFSYFMATVGMIYAQCLAHDAPEPAFDLKYAGVVVFLIGIMGNFYHHCILSRLRSSEDDKEYKIPSGGLFGSVICPHYLFEIIGFIGTTLISPTVCSLSFTLGSILYLMGRSYATRRWYLSKFEDFPREVRALIPFIF